ncbi:hypothetical protein ACWGFX_18075 [Streptomyces xanthophaeus]
MSAGDLNGEAPSRETGEGSQHRKPVNAVNKSLDTTGLLAHNALGKTSLD